MTEEEQLNRSLRDVRELLRKYNEIDEAARRQVGPEQSETEQNLQRLQRETRDRTQQGGQVEAQQREGENRDQRSEIARLDQQMERMQQQLDGMRQGNNGQDMRSALQSLSNNLNRLSNTGVLLDEAGLEYFKKNVYNPLSRLEFQLVQKLDEIEMDKKLHGSRKADVPPQYRKMVEKYYETISKAKKEKKQ